MTAADIYLVRHGETLWNASGRFQGAMDSQLTDRGRAQAKAVGGRLASILPVSAQTTLCVSPLGRARETATLVAAAGNYSAVVVEDRIREVSLGSWDGLSHDEIDAEWPRALDGATAFDWYFRSPDGEQFEAALARVHSWLMCTEGTVVAVSHGLIGRMIRGAYLGLSSAEMLSLDVSPEVIWFLSSGRAIPINDTPGTT